LLKLENLLRWSFFTFIYNRSSNMNYFIYTSHQKSVLIRKEFNFHRIGFGHKLGRCFILLGH